jgi:hypothetical protein
MNRNCGAAHRKKKRKQRARRIPTYSQPATPSFADGNPARGMTEQNCSTGDVASSERTKLRSQQRKSDRSEDN